MNQAATVYLIPATLSEDATHVIPPYVLDAVKSCDEFFVENERSARRYLKAVWREMVIDDYKWIKIGDAEESVTRELKNALTNGKNVGIISEAGCPAVADPGQILVAAAHDAGAVVKPLVGPSSILLALMASGMNGQRFQFNGYLPIDSNERAKAIRQMESDSEKKQCTYLFIETPYRNNQLLEALLQNLQPRTKLGVAADLTSRNEFIRTLPARMWDRHQIDLHKRPTIFSIYAGK